MSALEIAVRTLVKAMIRGQRAVVRANRARHPGQRNIQLGKLGCSLIVMGTISASATLLALHRLPEGITALPSLTHTIFLVIVGFIFVSGLAGITIGSFFLAMKNPGRYHHLATVVLWASCVAAAFAIGLLLVASISN